MGRLPLRFIWLLKGKQTQINRYRWNPNRIYWSRGRTIRSEIHQLINSIWNKEEHPEEWKESIIAPVYKKGDKTECSNYTGISLLSNLYKTFSSILLSRLTPYAEEITGDHQCGFRRNLSSTDNVILPSSNTWEKMGIDEAVHQLSTYLQKSLWFS